VVIQTQRPIEVGDEVEALGHNGVVRDLQGRAVVVETWDGKLVHLPNSEVLNNPLVNDTHRGARRSELEVRVASRDARSTREAVLRAVTSASGVLSDPEPRVYLTAIDPDRVTTLVHFWHAPSVSFSVTSDVLSALSVAGLGTMTAISPRPIAPFTPSPTV
jgi:small-conductance mechanosensitive channel